MPMEKYEISPLGRKAAELLEQALNEVLSGLDALPTVGAVEAVLRVEAGELPVEDIAQILEEQDE